MVGRQNAKFNKSHMKFYAYIIPMAIVMGLPIVYIINHAFKPIGELFLFPPRFFVRQPTLVNFTRLFEATAVSGIPASRYIYNSALVTVLVVILSVVIGSMSAFAFAKLQFKGRDILFTVNTLALMFVGTAVAIPSYLVVDNLGLIDTYLAHVLPLIAMPVGMFLLTQFIGQIPDSLIEAARIDGAGNLYVYRRIILPLIRPAIATIAILAFQGVWNNAGTSTMFINNEALRTLAFFMGTLTSAATVVAGQGMAAAAGLIMFLPNLILFIILQSKVINTMAFSGLK
jgi:ABC-type glycerol-3-phosphate transport system permease component